MRVSYAVENLRCIKEMELFELKPITVLVGRNNSGKSSYLRTIPLIKRSIEASSRLHSPVQWKDDNGFADFNNFATSVWNYNEKEEITFCFKVWDLKIVEDIFSFEYFLTGVEEGEKTIKCIVLKISIGQHENNTVIRRITVSIPEHDIEVSFERCGNEKKFKINNFEPKDNFFDMAIVPENNEIFSRYKFLHTIDVQRDMNRDFDFHDIPCYANIYNLLVQKSEKTGDPENNIHAATMNILKHFRITKEIFSNMPKSIDTDQKSIYKNISKEKNYETINILDGLCTIYWSVNSLNVALEVLNYVFLKSSYLSANRIGNIRLYPDCIHANITPDGKYLANYLSFFDDTPESEDENSFSSMVEEILGFKVSVEKKADNPSIFIDRKNLKVNLADTGQGVSQILPILAQIWESTWTSETGEYWDADTLPDYDEYIRLVAIEQPEANLHPEYQAKIADAIVWSFKEKHSTIKPVFVVETHSKAFVSRLGELIEFEGLPRTDIQIVFFSDEKDTENATKVSTAFFNDKGVLENWPIGFFEF